MKNECFTKELNARQILEIDACTQCGECLKHCPIQDVNNNPAIAPPEKFRMLREMIRKSEGLTAKLFGPREIDRKLLEDFASAVFECTVCGSCGENCPVGIFTQRLWPDLRVELVKRGLGPLNALSAIPKAIAASGNVYEKPPAERFKPWFPENVKVAERADIGYFAGCSGAYKVQPMVRGDVLALGAIGDPFCMLQPEEEVCCGFTIYITGQIDQFKDLVHKLVEGYRKLGVKVLLASCPCCVYTMSQDWARVYGKPLPFKIKHITQYVSQAIKEGKLKFKKELRERVIYRDPCYLTRGGVNVIEEPRHVLRSIPGLELMEFEHRGVKTHCCGAGGGVRRAHYEKGFAIGRLSIDEAVAKKADRMIMSCPACYDSVNTAMAGYKNQIRITDIMELVGEVL
jgi:heterodisulfide reductase subunit D